MLESTTQMDECHSDGEPRYIGIVVFPGFQIQDLSGPLAAFEMAEQTLGAYRCHVLSTDGGAIASSSGLEVLTRKMRHRSYDTIIVAGGNVWGDPADLPPLPDLGNAARRGTRRIASVCTGAFILAAAGMLDGRVATTHWKHAVRLQRLYPKVKVEGDRIFTKSGAIWTSAGVAAGIDLALALIAEDLGARVAQEIAQMLVVYYRRPGGQYQFY